MTRTPAPSESNGDDVKRARLDIGCAQGTTLKSAVVVGTKHVDRDWAKSFPGAFAFVLGPAC